MPDRQQRVVPFLKWAGGKRWLATMYEPFVSSPRSRYFEPFVGSAAMFFHLRPECAVLSDVNSDLVEAYQTVKEAPTEVAAVLEAHSTKHSADYYYSVRAQRLTDPIMRTARFIYLNRTCWNGLYRVNRAGDFNVPIGTKKSAILDTDDFETIAQVLANTELLCSDFEAQINRAEAGDFVFADPPYTVRHKHNGFIKYNEHLFSWDDQVRLRDALTRAKNRGAEILVTNADHESVRNLYKDFEIEEINRYSAIAGTATRRGKFEELIIR